MTIPVAINGVGYDGHELLASEQRRISQFLTFASPRDITDLSQIYKYTWPMTTPPTPDPVTGDIASAPNINVVTQYNTFIQTSSDTQGRPVYGVYLRDNDGTLHYLSGGTGANNVVVVSPSNNAMLGAGTSLIGRFGKVPGGNPIQIQAGDIVQNPTGATTISSTTTATIVGRIKFEAESGLSLASINLRLADINTVIETLAKILSTQSDMFNAAAGLVR